MMLLTQAVIAILAVLVGLGFVLLGLPSAQLEPRFRGASRRDADPLADGYSFMNLFQYWRYRLSQVVSHGLAVIGVPPWLWQWLSRGLVLGPVSCYLLVISILYTGYIAISLRVATPLLLLWVSATFGLVVYTLSDATLSLRRRLIYAYAAPLGLVGLLVYSGIRAVIHRVLRSLYLRWYFLSFM